MKKLLCIILSVAMLITASVTAFAEREYEGETQLKDNMLYINGISVPAAQLPNNFVYLPVEELEYYGFDIEKENNVYRVTRNEEKGIRSSEVPSSPDVLKVYTTSAEVYLDSDIPANVFELENGTVLIQSDELAKYGTYDWSDETHQIHIDFKNTLSMLPFMPFHNVIGEDDINEINSGVIVNNTEKTCADIDYEDLADWLKVYWNFNYDRVIAPLSAYDLSGNYIKLWNKDKSKSYVVYSNGGIIAGKYGKAYDSHGETKQNYVWYLPAVGNSRSALNSANMTLNYTYFNEVAEVKYKGEKQREFTQTDDIEIPQKDLLITSGASEWAVPETEKAAACNLMVYDLSDKYTQPITRYEFCRLIYRLTATEFSPDSDSRTGIAFAMQDILSEKGIQNATDNKFSDCYYTEAETLAAMGIIEGMGDGTFAPDAYITREQAAVILYRTAAFLGNKTLINSDPIYEDKNTISDWAVSAVSSMYSMNIMKGISDKEFNPKGQYTVEQAIATMVRLYECQ